MTRVAVVGAGFMGEMHARIFSSLPGVTLAAIVDRDRDRADGLANELEAVAYTDHRELLDRETLDLVSICTPDDLHLEPAVAAAKAGVNLFVEKPIASDPAHAAQIVAAARQAGVKLGVGYLLRFDPRYSKAHELLRSGSLGAPIHLYARRNSARTDGPQRYAGALPLALHVTVHDVDLVLWMLEGDQPVSVYAQQTNKLLGSLGTQDTIAAIVRFASGTVVNLESAWSLPESTRYMIDARLEMIGTEGAFEVQCGDSGLYVAGPKRSYEIDTQHWPSLDGRIGGDLRRQLEAVTEWVGGAAVDIASGEDAVRSLDLTLAIMRSAESGEVVRLDTGVT